MPRPEPLVVYDYPQPGEELPGDELEGPKIVWEKVAEFKASIAGGHVNNQGELTLTIKVPLEDKYLAMPVTDTLGVHMVWSVYKPEMDENDESTEANLDTMWGR